MARLTPRLTAAGLDVFAVNLPEGEDPNDFFQRHTAEDFDRLLREAKAASSTAAAAKAADDPAFAAKVDASVLRVVTLKERMGLLPCSTAKG